MITLTKLEANHILDTLEEVKQFLMDDPEGYIIALMEQVELAEEIIRSCLCNNEIDEGIPDE